jgi:hypothetical protein
LKLTVRVRIYNGLALTLFVFTACRFFHSENTINIIVRSDIDIYLEKKLLV